MARAPGAGLPKQTAGWASLKRAYRLLDRPEATIEAVTGAASRRGLRDRRDDRRSGPVCPRRHGHRLDPAHRHARARPHRQRRRVWLPCPQLPSPRTDLHRNEDPGTGQPERLDAPASAGQRERPTQRRTRRTEADVWAACLAGNGVPLDPRPGGLETPPSRGRARLDRAGNPTGALAPGQAISPGVCWPSGVERDGGVAAGDDPAGGRPSRRPEDGGLVRAEGGWWKNFTRR